MSEPDSVDSDRRRALALLDTFCARLLPGVLRRVGAWKALPAAVLAQLREDVVQELRLDCLVRARDLLQLDGRGRHAHWMQLAERALYRLRRHERRCQPLVDEPLVAAAAPAAATVELPSLTPLQNGRANIAATARLAGLGRRRMRRQLDDLAAQLGWDEDRRRFWQARAAEALVGLAADLLRSRRAVAELDEPPRPDLERRRARLQRLAQRFPVQPATLPVRRALQPWLRRRQRAPGPGELLQRAVALQPDRAAGWLWLFEWRCVERAPREAATALRRASGCPDAERAAVVLARARLLELRGQGPAALRLLRRARSRRDPDRRIARALALAAPPPGA